MFSTRKVTGIKFEGVKLRKLTVSGEWTSGKPDGSQGTLTLEGVNTWEELLDILEQPAEVQSGPIEAMTGMMAQGFNTEEEKELTLEEAKLAMSKRIAGHGAQELEKKVAAVVTAPKAVAAPATSSAAHGKKETASAPTTESAPAAANSPSEDFLPFKSMNKFQDVIQAILDNGAKDYEAVAAFVQRLKDAEACSLLTRVTNLDDRVKMACVRFGVPGAI